MGRKPLTIQLKVYLQGNLVGDYIKAPDGSTYFSYDSTWVKEGFPISQSLPLVTTKYKGEQVRAYFENLLPDLKEVRESIATKVKAKSSDHFDLLMAIGHDCIGALLFTNQNNHQNFQVHAPKGIPLSSVEIGQLLRDLKSSPLGMSSDLQNFRISLAGVQEKTALLWWKDQWQRPMGVTPTTHIFKPSMKHAIGGLDMSTSVHNEYFCMKFCQVLGLNVANVDLAEFDGEIVLVVERFDRLKKKNMIYRKPQEDMCQALGYFSHQKYQSDHGPGVTDFVSILKTSVKRQADLETLFKSLVVFYVLGAIDGHAKNYSIEYVQKGHRLAPLYDILSIYPALSEKEITLGKYKMAVSIGKSNHYTVKRIHRRHFMETAKICQLSELTANKIIDEVLEGINNQVWNKISYTDLFDQQIKQQIVTGINIISKRIIN